MAPLRQILIALSVAFATASPTAWEISESAASHDNITIFDLGDRVYTTHPQFPGILSLHHVNETHPYHPSMEVNMEHLDKREVNGGRRYRGISCGSKTCYWNDKKCDRSMECLLNYRAHCKPEWNCDTKYEFVRCAQKASCDKKKCPHCNWGAYNEYKDHCQIVGACPRIEKTDINQGDW